MRKDKTHTERTQPLLRLLYGGNKAGVDAFPLNVDALIIGKSAGCDVVLKATDVSQLHCVITRNGGCVAVRDCGSRAGTRINGSRVQSGTLHDDDILQIGPFSFRVELPPERNVLGDSTEPPMLRLERKRRRLTDFVLKQRRRIQQLETEMSAMLENTQDTPPPASLNDQIDSLQQRLRSVENRSLELQNAERDLARDRALLEEEKAEFAQTKRSWESSTNSTELEPCAPQGDKDAEEENLEQTRMLESPIDEEIADLEKTCFLPLAQLNGSSTNGHAVAPPTINGKSVHSQSEANSNADGEIEQKLHLRRRELDFYARGLRQKSTRLKAKQERLEELHRKLIREMIQMSVEQKEHLLTREQWVKEHKNAVRKLKRQQSALADAEDNLQDQREAVRNMMRQLKQLQEAVRSGHSDELEQLRAENAELRHLAEEFEREHQRIEEEQAEAAESEQSELQHLREENDMLREIIQEKDALIQQSSEEKSESAMDMPAVEDVDSYEAELVQFRRQLEEERETLRREMESLREKNEELDQATCEMEMQMSRERAQMARERSELERIRANVQCEMERLQKDKGISDRLEPVNRLREMMNNGQS